MPGRKFGHEVSIETRKKIGIAFKGRKLSEERKEKIRLRMIGNKYGRYLKGKKKPPRTEEHKRHISENHADFRGSKSPNWRGGISKQGYPFNFDKELKLLIRRRDNYTCQFPDCGVKENGKAHCTHHIDYNKRNLDPKNLVTLCRGCNVKANANREYWKGYFEGKAVR
jgi:5-methylcytosine-specific restriction endonuclease McrA